MKDNFSRQSGEYARYRPRYPGNLFEFLAGAVTSKKTAWDAGTGNGQTAAELARFFYQVIATDISTRQLEHAFRADNISYRNEPAEKTSIAAASVDLVTVSQALHWFKFEEFYAEVRRVAAPGAIFAAWTYSRLACDPKVEELMTHFHFNILKDYWDPERKYVEDKYSTIPFPFKNIPVPDFQIKTSWSLQDMEGYINTWSAVQKFIAAEGKNPVTGLVDRIARYWAKGETKEIIFPVHLKMGYIH